jgi:hypothetical protein
VNDVPKGAHDESSNGTLQTLQRCVNRPRVGCRPLAWVWFASAARGRGAMTSMKQLVQAPAQESGPRHRNDRAEAKNRHCNNFADHSLTNSRVTKALQKMFCDDEKACVCAAEISIARHQSNQIKSPCCKSVSLCVAATDGVDGSHLVSDLLLVTCPQTPGWLASLRSRSERAAYGSQDLRQVATRRDGTCPTRSLGDI